MRNLFFALTFMLVGTFAFANDNTNSNQNKLDNVEIKINKQSINLNNYDLGMLFFDCTITIKNNKTGDSYTITIHGKSCEELIKEIMK